MNKLQTEILTPEVLKARQSVHDAAAVDLMRSAQRHLRESCRLSKQLERLETKAQTP